MKLALLALAWLFAAPLTDGVAQTTPPPVVQALDVSTAEGAARQFADELRKAKAHNESLEPTTSVREELARRVALDQKVRTAYRTFLTSQVPIESVRAGVEAEILAIDTDNTTYLKSVLPSDGWFKQSRDGEEATSDAWLLVQHSPDKGFMRRVLVKMEPLAAAGEVDGRDYALLFDRVQMQDGKAQRFGSQVICQNHIRTFYALENPTNIDAERRRVGHPESFAETATRLRVGSPCQ